MPSATPDVTFEQLFESNGKWVLGPPVLSAIIQGARGKAVTLSRTDEMDQLVASLPAFPQVQDGMGEMVDIYHMIPFELRDIFNKCCNDTLRYREMDIQRVGEHILGRPVDNLTIDIGNSILQSCEQARITRDDPEDPELWKLLARQLGFHWAFLPRPLIEPHDHPGDT